MAAAALFMLVLLWTASDVESQCVGFSTVLVIGGDTVSATGICFSAPTGKVEDARTLRCSTFSTPVSLTFTDNVDATTEPPCGGFCVQSSITPTEELIPILGNATCTCPSEGEVIQMSTVPIGIKPALPQAMSSRPPQQGDSVIIGSNGCLPRNGLVSIDCTDGGNGTKPITYGFNFNERMLTVSQAGQYFCQVTSPVPGTDCNAVSSTIITDEPVVSVIGETCVGDSSIQLTCSIIAGTDSLVTEDDITRMWTSTIGAPVSGATLDVTVPGTYTCTATSPCGMSTDSIEVLGVPAVVIAIREGDSQRVAPSTLCLDDDPELVCSAFGNGANVTVTWTNPSGATTTDSTISLTMVGEYTCTISVPGCGNSSQTINAIIRPVLNSTGEFNADDMIVIGEDSCLMSNPDTSIDCTPDDGTPPFTYVWISAGVLLEDATESTYEPQDPGPYMCKVSNDCGEAEATSVIIGPPEVEIRVTRTTESLVCLDGPDDSVVLRCVVTSTNISDIPNMFTWTGPSGPLTDTDSSITVMGNDDSGTYTCTVTRQNCGSGSDSRNIGVAPAVQGSNGTVPGPDISVGENTLLQPNLTIMCTGTGTGPFEYEWSRDGMVLSETSDVLAVTEPGMYTCCINNVCGKSDGVTSVIRGIAPTISLPTDDPTVTIPTPPPTNEIFIGQDICTVSDEDIVINCDTEAGTEPIDFTWRRNNVPITATGMSLTVPGDVPATYTCVATNPFGISVANTTIYVQVIPSISVDITGRGSCDALLRPPPEGIEYCAFTGDDIEVTCTASDGVSDVTIVPSNTRLENVEAVEGDVLTYVCSAANQCGNNTDAVNIAVYEPAVVERDTPLPPPTIQGGEVIGAGRSDESVRVPSNTALELYCPFTGVNLPTTTWVRIDPITGDTMDVSDMTVSINDTLILIIDPFTSEEEGTYRCFTENIAGEDEAEVVLRVEDPEPPEWRTTPWSRCDPFCNMGKRTRRVYCAGQRSGLPLPDSRCTEEKPQTWERCINLGPCFTTPVWGFDPWSQCTRECNGGTRERRVFCVIPATGDKVSDSRCSGTKPSSYESCNTHSCCIKDMLPDFCASVAGTETCNVELVNMNLCCWTCSQSGH